MDELKAKYNAQVAEYEKTTDPAKKKALNASIAKTLNEMIEKLTYMRKETPDIKRERDELVKKLQRIQYDYNGLLTNTDQLETLRRIEEQENGSARRTLYWYLIAFFSVVVLLCLYVLFYAKSPATAAIASAVPATPALI